MMFFLLLLRSYIVGTCRSASFRTASVPMINHIFLSKNKKLAASKAYSIPPAISRSKLCKFVKKYFFSIKLLHAHLQYVCNIPTMHLKDTLKALGEVDFTK